MLNGILDRLLARYGDSDYIIMLKTRFLLRVSIAGIVVFPFIIAYNIYLSLTKAAFGYSIYWPIIAPLLIVYIIYITVIILIARGRFAPAGHLFFIASQFLIWSIVIVDKSGPVERLDTIIILFAILAMSPLVIKKNPFFIIIYSAVTALASMIFAIFYFPEMSLGPTTTVDFIGDICIASVVVAIMTYNLFSINRAALDKSEESRAALARVNADLKAVNEELTASNEEIESAMEELAASNEAFEEQNRDLAESQRVITESLEEKEVLLKEVHHRVKNNMQIISSLLNMQSENIRDPLMRQTINDAISRIHSMALIHEKIYQAGNFSRIDMAAYITELLNDIILLSSKNPDDIHVAKKLAPVHLSIGQAIPCGILINEILTNSIKYGCRDSGGCRVDLEMSVHEDMVTLVIADNGPGIERDMLERGDTATLGMQLINALARQLNAELEVGVDGGTRFTIRFSSREGQ
ncbi:MAG: hypothetical protein JXA07_05595 [Spirochaetes bacterium]|nr:hypothetical protein [Spirochaetota bacterium]